MAGKPHEPMTINCPLKDRTEFTGRYAKGSLRNHLYNVHKMTPAQASKALSEAVAAVERQGVPRKAPTVQVGTGAAGGGGGSIESKDMIPTVDVPSKLFAAPTAAAAALTPLQYVEGQLKHLEGEIASRNAKLTGMKDIEREVNELMEIRTGLTEQRAKLIGGGKAKGMQR